MLDAFGGGGGLESLMVLLLGVDSIHYNTRQTRNDKHVLREVHSIHYNTRQRKGEKHIIIVGGDSIHYNTRHRRHHKQVLIVGVDSSRTQSGGLQQDKVKIQDFNIWLCFGNDKTNRCWLQKNSMRRAHNLLRSIENK
jgi:NAD kinase